MGVSQQYREYLQSMAYSESTIRQRLRLVALLGDPLTADRDAVLRVVSRPGSPSARRVYLAHLRAAYSDFAWLGFCGHDPTAGIRVSHSSPPPPRPLTDRQVEKLLAGLPPRMRGWTVLGCYAGLRACEVWQLQPHDFDGARLQIRGKGGKAASVPTHPLVAEVMDTWRPPGYSSASHLSSAWAAKARPLAGPVRFHQCRHTFATRLLAATGDLMLVRDAMRHSSVATTQRYVQVVDGRVAAAVVALAA